MQIIKNSLFESGFGRFFRCAVGAAFIEFAVVTPVVLLLIMGIIEYSLIMFGEATLEGALNNAAREGSTNFIANICPDGSTVPASQGAYINCLLRARVEPLMDPNSVELTSADYPATGNSCTGGTAGANSYSSVTSPTFSECSNSTSATSTSTPPSCSSQQNLGCAGDVVVYTAHYKWHIITPFLNSMVGGGDGTFTLQSSAVVKNEPYTSTSR